MTHPDLQTFWSENKLAIGKALPQGAAELATVLQPGADLFELAQEVEGRFIRWKNPDGRVALTFGIIPDPRNLDAVLDAYVQAKEKKPAITAVLVHQWIDGEGNWDVFVITSRRATQHVDRITGSDRVQERGPELREDIYTLFACDRDFPEPGPDGWAELLAGPVEGITDRLERLADEHGCTLTVQGGLVQWFGDGERLEAQFFILPDPEDIDARVRMYQQIGQTRCPVSFVFVKCDEPRSYDIFRLSARSYLEHHNRIKAPLRLQVTGEGKMLEDLRWTPRWASHVGCIKGCLNYLGIDVSDAWLFGATGHAFVLNISPGLCPSAPTDWDTSGFLRLGRNLGYRVDIVDKYCPRKQDLRGAQERAFDHVRRSIDEGVPCYGWEVDIPEYSIIYGYDKTGYYISGPECDDGAGPISWKTLGTSEIGVVLVASVQRAEPADTRQTVREALSYAVDLGQNRIRWTDRTGGLDGYELWITTLRDGKADRFGLGYNAAVWAESRRFAVQFLEEARQRLGGSLEDLFDEALVHYEVVAERLKAVSEAYPFTDRAQGSVAADDWASATAELLEQARRAEAAGLDVLAELVTRLSGKRR